MKLKLFTIYDRVTDVHSTLFTSVNEGQAVRQVNSLRKNPNHPLNDYPHEMDLYEIGEFDDNVATLAGKPIRKVGSLASLDITYAKSQENQVSPIHG